MTASQEVASDSTSNTRTTRRTLAGRTPRRKQLAYGTAERLTFTTAPERQDEHYQAVRRPNTRPCPCSCTNCLTATTSVHEKGRIDANCLTALEMSQLGDGCSLQYQGGRGGLI